MPNLIIIPTFNEKENISRIIDAIRGTKVSADILVVDDNSPDGTGKIADRISKKDKTVHVMHRKEKAGLGKAYVAGFKWGLENKYGKLVSMDADFSHPVDSLCELLKICSSGTVAIGSRYIRDGHIVGWKWPRYLNSWGANYVTRLLLGIKAKDATAGFKCYPQQFLKKIDLDNIQSAGYAFQVEMLLLAQENNFKLKETPITFVDRQVGESKIQGELAKSAKIVFKLAAGKRSYRQFVKFGIVGAINSLLDWGIFYPLKIFLPSAFGFLSLQSIKQIAKATSFVVSALSSYVMNRKWTFRSVNKNVRAEGIKFMTVAAGGLVINSFVFYLVTSRSHFRDIFGLLIATAVATLWNFFLNKIWTFKK